MVAYWVPRAGLADSKMKQMTLSFMHSLRQRAEPMRVSIRTLRYAMPSVLCSVHVVSLSYTGVAF